MSGLNTQEALCAQMPAEVADKYFMADYYQERFQFRTGQLICRACPIQLECLTEAVERPGDHFGIQGGETARSIRSMHTTYNQTGVPAEDLARRAIARHRHHQDLIGYMRTADFRPNLPALPSGPVAGRRTA